MAVVIDSVLSFVDPRWRLRDLPVLGLKLSWGEVATGNVR